MLNKPNKVIASTLSVLLSPKDSILCYLEINDESCNVSLRFEDDKARIAGYPVSWKIWDERIEGNEEYSYEDAENDPSIESPINEIESITVYISRETEKNIFKKLKNSLKKQFEDEMFKDQLTDIQKEEAFNKIDQAIRSL